MKNHPPLLKLWWTGNALPILPAGHGRLGGGLSFFAPRALFRRHSDGPCGGGLQCAKTTQNRSPVQAGRTGTQWHLRNQSRPARRSRLVRRSRCGEGGCGEGESKSVKVNQTNTEEVLI